MQIFVFMLAKLRAQQSNMVLIIGKSEYVQAYNFTEQQNTW